MKFVPIIFIIILLFGMAGIFTEKLQPVSNLQNETVTLDIIQGVSFNEIAEKIDFLNLVRSKAAFKFYAFITGKAHKIKSGVYVFKSPVSAIELLRILIDGPQEISITIFPGMTLKEIDDRLSESGIIKKNELIDYDVSSAKSRYSFLNNSKSLEGYFLPDTYYFYQNSGIELIVDKALDNFKARALPFFKEGDNILNILKIASLLEKEIPDNGERQIVAGILSKRLKIGMPLQIDATIIYVKCQGRFLNCGNLKKEDYKIDSPYNTYIYYGLIPAPIANPSVEAIKAAIEKKDSLYWYYLSDPKTKKTIFAKTLDEHNQNRAKYLLK